MTGLTGIELRNGLLFGIWRALLKIIESLLTGTVSFSTLALRHPVDRQGELIKP
jgi:hypothetical protein